jgi:uncharacterized membrane protein YeaQ/YmgE (transglycosylase-associated protein family)
MMSIVTWLLAGSLVGWAASCYLQNTRRDAMVLNVGVGVLGAVLAAWTVAPMLGVASGLGLFGLVVSACGAAALLFCVHVVQQTGSR